MGRAVFVLMPGELGRQRPKDATSVQVRPILPVLPNILETNGKAVDPQDDKTIIIVMGRRQSCGVATR